MTEVVKHKARDGSLHDGAFQCEMHNVNERRLKMFKDFCAKKIVSAPKKSRYVTIDGGLNFVIKLDHLPDFLVENADMILKVMQQSLEKPPPRRPTAGRPRLHFDKPAQPQAGA